MILALPHDVRERLDHIELSEGVPPIEVCHQAIDVYSHLNAEERRQMGMYALHLVVDRQRSPRTGDHA